MYSLEKLSDAVRILATHPEEVRIRLRVAFESLAMVQARSLPDSFAARFDAILRDLTKFEPAPEVARAPEKPYGLTALGVTLRKIRKVTGGKIAERIYQLQSELESRLEDADGKALASGPPAVVGKRPRSRRRPAGGVRKPLRRE